VKKDIDIARRYYMQAAERGNARRCTNLAVTRRRGGRKGAENYQEAAPMVTARRRHAASRQAVNRGIPLSAAASAFEQTLAESSNG